MKGRKHFKALFSTGGSKNLDFSCTIVSSTSQCSCGDSLIKICFHLLNGVHRMIMVALTLSPWRTKTARITGVSLAENVKQG